MYDALGSLFLKKHTFQHLVKKGAKVAGFHPLRLFSLRFNVNFRNHRKILLVDDNIAFTGGTNIGKEYLGRLSPTQWLDYTVRVEGPVARQLQDVFCGDWHFTTNEEIKVSNELIRNPSGSAVIQVLESGPDTEFKALYQAIFSAINQAKDEILLTTPYFIPDPAINTALQVAAMQGVKVKIILPQKNDAPMVQRASRSFYEDLLAVGVQIYEYIPRVLHAKMMIIDGKMTFLGSANMDIRSFRLNFELNLLIFGSDVAMQAKDFFMKDLSMSQPGLLTPVSFANVIGSDMQNFNATTSGLDFVTVESAATLEPGFVNFGLFMNYAVNTLPYFEKTETIQSRTKFNDTLLGADINVCVVQQKCVWLQISFISK